jgi:hypothetical protein
MKNTIPHTIFLQDGSALNINKRIAKQALALQSFLTEIPDPRKSKGQSSILKRSKNTIKRTSIGHVVCG